MEEEETSEALTPGTDNSTSDYLKKMVRYVELQEPPVEESAKPPIEDD
jgi:hypothetical protein